MWVVDRSLPLAALLGSPIGHPDFARSFLEKKTAEHSVLLERIPAVPDLPSAWLLLLFCADARSNFWLRCGSVYALFCTVATFFLGCKKAFFWVDRTFREGGAYFGIPKTFWGIHRGFFLGYNFFGGKQKMWGDREVFFGIQTSFFWTLKENVDKHQKTSRKLQQYKFFELKKKRTKKSKKKKCFFLFFSLF